MGNNGLGETDKRNSIIDSMDIRLIQYDSVGWVSMFWYLFVVDELCFSYLTTFRTRQKVTRINILTPSFSIVSGRSANADKFISHNK